MKNQRNFISILTIILFTATIIFGITACNMQQNMEKGDKDIAEVQNETRFDNDTTQANDANFLVETAWINIHEIALGQLGTDKSKSPEILVLSKMLTEEHTIAAAELKIMADKKNISLPVSAENDKDENIGKLIKTKNSIFDKTYIEVVIQYHKEAIDKFEAQDSISTDIEIKDYIATVLPTLKKHLEQAELIQKTIK